MILGKRLMLKTLNFVHAGICRKESCLIWMWWSLGLGTDLGQYPHDCWQLCGGSWWPSCGWFLPLSLGCTWALCSCFSSFFSVRRLVLSACCQSLKPICWCCEPERLVRSVAADAVNQNGLCEAYLLMLWTRTACAKRSCWCCEPERLVQVLGGSWSPRLFSALCCPSLPVSETAKAQWHGES